MEHVAGEPWTAEDFGRADRLGQLGAALHVLHAVTPPPVAAFDIETSLERHYERLSAALPAESALVSKLMDRAASGPSQRAERRSGPHTRRPQRSEPRQSSSARTAPLSAGLGIRGRHRSAAGSRVHPGLLPAGRGRMPTRCSTPAGFPIWPRPRCWPPTTWLFILLSYFWHRSAPTHRPGAGRGPRGRKRRCSPGSAVRGDKGQLSPPVKSRAGAGIAHPTPAD